MFIFVLTFAQTARDDRTDTHRKKRPHEHTNPTNVRVGEDLHGIVTMGDHAGGDLKHDTMWIRPVVNISCQMETVVRATDLIICEEKHNDDYSCVGE